MYLLGPCCLPALGLQAMPLTAWLKGSEVVEDGELLFSFMLWAKKLGGSEEAGLQQAPGVHHPTSPLLRWAQ